MQNITSFVGISLDSALDPQALDPSGSLHNQRLHELKYIEDKDVRVQYFRFLKRVNSDAKSSNRNLNRIPKEVLHEWFAEIGSDKSNVSFYKLPSLVIDYFLDYQTHKISLPSLEPEPIDWIKEAVELEEKGFSDHALDLIYGKMDDMFLAGEFMKSNSILEYLSIDDYSPDILLTFLTVSWAAHTKLPVYESFFSRVKESLIERDLMDVELLNWFNGYKE